jgi:hypothetical protein
MTSTTPARVCQNGVASTMSGVKGWEEMDLDTTLPGIVKIENERWHHQPMRPKSMTVPQPKNNKPRSKKAGQATGPTPPSKAEMFMQSRPGGKLETKGNEMKGAERRVSAQLQKKGTTSAEGRKVLDGITKSVANENKENEVADPASTATKRKKTGEPAVLKTPTKKKAKGAKKKAAGKQKTGTSGAAINNKTKRPVARCKYGCKHGGLLELVQMIPKCTKHHLKEGEYLHKKECKDCKKSVREIFERSNGKRIFYYCHMDNKVANLSFDDPEMETTACACTLCLPCYYKRDEKKKLASGKTTRFSRRGRG